jgi:hypothetical protein
MWVVTHVLAGLAIAAVVESPLWLVAVLVVLSHVLMDLIPHWDYTVSLHQVGIGALDFLVSFAAFAVCWLALGWPFWLAFMGLVSGAPDWDIAIAMARGDDARKWFPSHWRRFPHGRSGPVWGIGVQVAMMAASVVTIAAAGPE